MWKSNLCRDRGRGLRALSIFDAMVSHPAAVVKSIVAKSSILTTGLRTYIVTLRSISSVVACHHWNAVVFIFSSPAMKLLGGTIDGLRGSRRGIGALSCAIISHPTSIVITSIIAPLLSIFVSTRCRACSWTITPSHCAIASLVAAVIISIVAIHLIFVAIRCANTPTFITIHSNFTSLLWNTVICNRTSVSIISSPTRKLTLRAFGLCNFRTCLGQG